MELGGLHHLTAVTTDAKQNVDFYTRVLGMRLVKKTVNQDDVSAYHLFYADALGSPGTDVTFFDWPHLRIAPNRPGAGEVSVTGLRVPDREALQWWAGRLEDSGVGHGGVQDDGGRLHLEFQDPEGQRLRPPQGPGAGAGGGAPAAPRGRPSAGARGGRGGVEGGGGRLRREFQDPEGQRLRLSEDRGEGTEGGKPWEGRGVPAGGGLRGRRPGGPAAGGRRGAA